MARGIIVSMGGGGVPPKLTVTDFDPSQKAYYVPGHEVDCDSQIPLKVGFLVEGVIDPNNTKVIRIVKVLDSSPTVITGSQGGNITIGADKAYLVQSTGQLTGNVNVNGGVLLVEGGKATGNVSIDSNSTIIAVNGATIGGGSFEVTGSGMNAVVVFSNSNINGKFSTTGITFVKLGANDFNGNVDSNQDHYVHIKDNNINNGKDLTVSQVLVECKISNNNVSGTTTLDPKCQP